MGVMGLGYVRLQGYMGFFFFGRWAHTEIIDLLLNKSLDLQCL